MAKLAALQSAQRGKLLGAPCFRTVRHAPHSGLKLRRSLVVQLQGKPLHRREHRVVGAQACAQVRPPRRAIGAHIGIKLERRLLRHPGERRQRPIGQVSTIPTLHIGRSDVPHTLRYARRRPPVHHQGNGEAKRWPDRTRCPRSDAARAGQPHGPGEQAPAPRARTAPRGLSPQPSRQRPAYRPNAQPGNRRRHRSVLAAGSTVITSSRAGRRSRHRNRSRRRPPVRSRAKGIARDICQQGRPCILPRRECEANPHAFGRANGALASGSGANLHVHPRTGGEKRFLTRGKRSSIFQQHAQRALRQKLREQSQSLPRLDHPQLRQPIKVSPDHPQHRHFRARHPLKRASTAGTPCCASCTAASKAGRPTPAATQAAATRSSPSAPASPAPADATPSSAMRPSADSHRPLPSRTSPASANTHRPLAPSAARAYRFSDQRSNLQQAPRKPRATTPRAQDARRTSCRRRTAPKDREPTRRTRQTVTPISEQPLSAARSCYAAARSVSGSSTTSYAIEVSMPDILAHPLSASGPIHGTYPKFRRPIAVTQPAPPRNARKPAALSDDRPSETDLSRNRSLNAPPISRSKAPAPASGNAAPR